MADKIPTYLDRIRVLTAQLPTSICDFSLPRDVARMPTQASSNFITNKEQGDWAEKLIFTAINETSKNYVAVRYGKSDDLVAGDTGFDVFFEEFQAELDEIGKRPDLLIFRKADFDKDLGLDISKVPHARIDDYVRKAVAGIEVRSSAFLIDKYESEMQKRMEKHTDDALLKKREILDRYYDLLSEDKRKAYLDILNGITEDTLLVADFKVPNWRASTRLAELSDLFRSLKNDIREVQKRDYLSITPKVEDLKVVYKWIETYRVPHFYFQVFFDKVYGISFERILEVISDEDCEGVSFSIEQDTKNQNKTTVKIKSKVGAEIAGKVDEPSHRSVRKEMGRGRLLFYVSFDGGRAYLDVSKLAALLNISERDF